MPEFVFVGPYAVTPEGRDARNIPLGLVEPGDIRDLNEPPGGDWLPLAGNEDHPVLRTREDGSSKGGDGSAPSGNRRSFAASPASPPAPPAGPKPAPPAVIPATAQEG